MARINNDTLINTSVPREVRNADVLTNIEILTALEVGERTSWPIANMSTIRAQASNTGLILNRKYRTKIDKEKSLIHVIRLK